MGLNDKLTAIQTELNVPKSRFNKFGGYAFRSAEDIMDAVKPLLAKHECSLRIDHELLLVADRFYNVAFATLTDNDTGESLTVKDYAREDAERKGMTGDQLSGCASSYATKYALKSMFLLDDSDDSDATNGQAEQQEKKQDVQQEKKQKPQNKANEKAEKAKAVSRLKAAIVAYANMPDVAQSANEILDMIRADVEKDKSKNTAEWYNDRAAEFEEAARA